MRSIRRIAIGLLVLVLAGAGVAYLERSRIQAWHTVRSLCRADEANREEWIDRVAALGEPAREMLFDRLATGEDRAADNSLAAIDHIARVHGPGHAKTADLVRRLADQFETLSPGRQTQVLQRVRDWLTGGPLADPLPDAACRLITEAGRSSESTVQAAGLDLACIVVKQPGGEISLPVAREVARAGIRSPSPDARLHAVRLCLAPGVGLLDQLVGLLRDPCPVVRRATILALGSADQVIGEDGILAGLNDTDADVRRLTQIALEGRGMKSEHIEMGRLLTHPRAGERLHVLDHVYEAIRGQGTAEVDIDPGLWLRRLSHDPSPAVRVAALRLMCKQNLVDLNDRIDQMARTDDSPTVCQLAQFYLTTRVTR